MRTSDNPLAPIPKVWVPAAAALVAIVISGIFTGEFSTAELAAFLTALGYFVIGYTVPTDGVGTGRTDAGASRRQPVDSETRPFDQR